MQTLSVELDEETLQALEVERSLIGFESRDAYVRWIIAHRAAIEHETEMGDVLDAYSDRIANLESRLESIESGTSSSEGAATAESGSAGSPETTQRRPASSDGGWTETATDDTTATVSPDEPETGDTATETAGAEPGTQATVSRPDESGQIDSGNRSDESESSGTTTSSDAAIDSMNLRPERVERIRDDELSDDAGVLGSVEVDRLDELSRRAVAKTRKQLDRDVETGLEYDSATSLAETSDDVRPGEDITGLTSIDVPGRSHDLVEQRQELIGVALAHLRDAGAAKKGDFVDSLYDEYPAGYGSPGGWWRCLKKGLKQVECVSGGDGSRIWRLDD
ncbi:hypothetical protein Halru_1182 [Halovivax ruber XH-70]|uniref:Uncharacterized protein n=1 Tax=Halovivax ruber (strain DSM 18193 / JCM 13892 / XH-70) TaxID=797302 RepID=L0IAN9_HALRX|nr:hypothetical protein [Halovivax ruber]AGB15799.1 hypothetical protein Halru_1182 [Halovivax ruber XH-70]